MIETLTERRTAIRRMIQESLGEMTKELARLRSTLETNGDQDGAHWAVAVAGRLDRLFTQSMELRQIMALVGGVNGKEERQRQSAEALHVSSERDRVHSDHRAHELLPGKCDEVHLESGAERGRGRGSSKGTMVSRQRAKTQRLEVDGRVFKVRNQGRVV